jgi:hypothetical protein
MKWLRLSTGDLPDINNTDSAITCARRLPGLVSKSSLWVVHVQYVAPGPCSASRECQLVVYHSSIGSQLRKGMATCTLNPLCTYMYMYMDWMHVVEATTITNK